MKTISVAVLSLDLLSPLAPALAQYDGRGDGYRGRGDTGFDEQEYLRCNPDVLRAVQSGTMPSGLTHYQQFGIREGRRLSC